MINGGRRTRNFQHSKLIMDQVIFEYKAKVNKMLEYLEKVRELLEDFVAYTITQVSRKKIVRSVLLLN